MRLLKPIDSQSNNANTQRKTSFANCGRIAGMGMCYDRYDEESGTRWEDNLIFGKVHMPSDYLPPEEKAMLDGECIIVQKTKNIKK